MIISSSNVSMLSDRKYSKHIEGYSKTTKQALGRSAYSQTYARFKRSYSEQYSSFNSAKGDDLLSRDALFKKGMFLSDHLNKLLTSDSSDSYDASKASDLSDVKTAGSSDNTKESSRVTYNPANYGLKGGNLFDDTTTDVLGSLWQFLENLRFRSLFSFDFGATNSTLDLAKYQSADNTVLNMTNSDNYITWKVSHEESYFMEEKECTTFQGTGSAVTADGRELSFDITMQMSREYMKKADIAYVEKYDQILTDPIVINLKDNPATLTGKTFLFDLDNDGKEEEISQLSSNSGFLALDKNGDGIINDGSELFGPNTGNGFDELAKYDSDGNGWIDEADEIYSQLKVWVKDEDGNDKLLSLKDADVGAIYLGNQRTDFSLKDDENNLHGQVKSTGIYLHENGNAGTVQQIDL